MQYEKYLRKFELSNDELLQAKASLAKAKQDSKGLLKIKLIARYLLAGKLARLVVDNKTTRVCLVKPEWTKYDIAKAKNINAFGDNDEWGPNGPLDRNVYSFVEGSEEYNKAVARNYWCKGVFPGAFKAVKAWYRRNGGEQEAVERGVVVPNTLSTQNLSLRQVEGIKLYECNGAWQVVAEDKFLGIIPVKIRIGYEIDNLFDFKTGLQMRFALDGEQLKAPVSWSVLPKF